MSSIQNCIDRSVGNVDTMYVLYATDKERDMSANRFDASGFVVGVLSVVYLPDLTGPTLLDGVVLMSDFERLYCMVEAYAKVAILKPQVQVYDDVRNQVRRTLGRPETQVQPVKSKSFPMKTYKVIGASILEELGVTELFPIRMASVDLFDRRRL